MMKKLVKLLKGSEALNLDGVDNYDDLAVDDYSQDEHSLASEHVSDYSGQLKDAPSQIYIGPERCRKVFQLASDTDTSVKHICGGPEDCWCPGHKNIEDHQPAGMYESVKTAKYTNGLIGTYWSQEEDEAKQARHVEIQAEAVRHLMGTVTYQDQVKAIKDEFKDDIYDGYEEEGKSMGRAMQWYDMVTLETKDLKPLALAKRPPGNLEHSNHWDASTWQKNTMAGPPKTAADSPLHQKS